MNKILLSLALVVGFSATAQDHHSYSFLNNVQAIVVTNGFSFTNLSLLNGIVATNIYGTHYTNGAGEQVVVNGVTNNQQNVFKTVSLWSDRQGSWQGPAFAVSESTNATVQTFSPSYANISVKGIGGSGANVACAIIIVPVIDDAGNESTAAADQFAFTVTPVTTSWVSVFTNAPMYRWIGCKGLKVKSITAGDTDASSQFVITEINLNGFQP